MTSLKQLLPIREEAIGTIHYQCVSARDLHSFLGSRKDFTSWFKSRISTYGFKDGEDFSPIWVRSEAGRNMRDFCVTIDMAKELSMVERTVKGREARQYFINCEKQLKSQEIAPAPLSTAQMLLQSAQLLVEIEERQKVTDKRLELLEAKTTTRPDYMTVAGFLRLKGKTAGVKKCAEIGRKAAAACKREGIETEPVRDVRWGEVNSYPSEILETIFSTL